MSANFFSPVALYGTYLRHCFTSSGLIEKTIDVDKETTIQYWGPNTKTPSQQKPTLLLIHGFGPVAIWQWRRQVQHFSSRYNLYVPNLIFFGGSTTKSSERSEVFQAASLAKLLDKLGVSMFHVMGTSYGGFVAYRLAHMLGSRVQKVVIASSGVNLRKSDNDALLKKAKVETIEQLMLPSNPDELRALMGLSLFKSFSILPDFFLKDIIKNFYSDKRKEKMELLKGLSLINSATISPIEQDVLILWGDQDQIFPVKMAIELKGVISENARLELIKGASHVPQIEKPKQFNDIVLNFLNGTF